MVIAVGSMGFYVASLFWGRSRCLACGGMAQGNPGPVDHWGPLSLLLHAAAMLSYLELAPARSAPANACAMEPGESFTFAVPQVSSSTPKAS
jgi:hypothetical protein